MRFFFYSFMYAYCKKIITHPYGETLMNSFRFHRFLPICLSGLLFVLLAACGPTPPPITTGSTPAPVATLTQSVTPGGTATPPPPTPPSPTPVVTPLPPPPPQP